LTPPKIECGYNSYSPRKFGTSGRLPARRRGASWPVSVAKPEEQINTNDKRRQWKIVANEEIPAPGGRRDVNRRTRIRALRYHQS
jgi:hypothetical protein